MAITWDTRITNVDLAAKRADVLFTRTDDVSGDVWSASYTRVILETTPQRAALLNQVWAAWQASLAYTGDITEFVGLLESQANDNLEARET